METKIVTTAFGDRRKELREFIAHVRKWSSAPILVVTDNILNSDLGDQVDVKFQWVKTQWQDHKRCHYRSSNWWRFKILQEIDADLVVYMDNDIRLINVNWLQGFSLANLFGICMPLSPRVFVHYDAKRGIDAQVKSHTLPIPCAPVCNPGFFFAAVHDNRTKQFVKSFLAQYQQNPGRGPLGVWLAAESCGYHPNAESCANYAYPEVEPIAVHWGGKAVKQYFGGEVYHCGKSV